MLYKKFSQSIPLAWHYLKFLIMARHRKGHNIHSPYIYHLISKVVFDHTSHTDYAKLLEIEKELAHDTTPILVRDLGADSSHFSEKERSVKQLLKVSSVRRKYGRLLFRITKQFQPETIIELGTSIGFSTLFLAFGAKKSIVYTLEGNQALCQFSANLFKKKDATNIEVIEGNFKSTFQPILKASAKPVILFIDGNHSYKPTIEYFNIICEFMDEGIIIFDDIYWSKEMRQAWKEIQSDSRSHVCINLFFMGIVIRRKSITPGNYYLRY